MRIQYSKLSPGGGKSEPKFKPMRESPKQKLRKLPILQTLPYIEIAEAHRYIDKGADLQLIYFWINLNQDKFHPFFDTKGVMEQAEYFMNKFPNLSDDIVKWFTKYAEQRGKKEIHVLVQKLQTELSNENTNQQPDNGKLPEATEDPSI